MSHEACIGSAVLLRHVIFCTLYCLPNCPLVLLNIKYFVKFYSFTLNTTNNYDTRNELWIHNYMLYNEWPFWSCQRFDSNDSMFSMFLRQLVTNLTCKFRTVRIFRGPFHTENVQLLYHKISGTNPPIRCKNDLLNYFPQSRNINQEQ